MIWWMVKALEPTLFLITLAAFPVGAQYRTGPLVLSSFVLSELSGPALLSGKEEICREQNCFLMSLTSG